MSVQSAHKSRVALRSENLGVSTLIEMGCYQAAVGRKAAGWLATHHTALGGPHSREARQCRLRLR
jgi:hypothetical protein